MTIQQQRNRRSEPVSASDAQESPVRLRPQKRAIAYILTFIIMLGIWIVFSGKFDLFHLSLGIISCTLTSIYGGEMLFPKLEIRKLPIVWFRFARYLPWLLYQVLVANIHVLYLTFHPKMIDLIDPQIIIFKSQLKSDLALLTLANSITLTPGTITVHISIYGDVTFHAIDVESGQSVPWIMDARIAEIFGE